MLADIALLSRNARLQRFAFQAAFTAATVLVARVLVSNLTTELDQINLEVMPFIDVNGSFPFISLHLDFLEQRAGFGISETSFGREYTENRSYGEAYLTGLLNTLRVAILGIVLASAVGLVVGLARLSCQLALVEIGDGLRRDLPKRTAARPTDLLVHGRHPQAPKDSRGRQFPQHRPNLE